MYSKYPPINDFSSDLDNPPAFKEISKLRGKNMSFPDKNKKIILDLNLLPPHRELAMGATAAFSRCLDVAKKQSDWEIVVADDKAFHIEAVATTKLLRFKDDVVIRVRETAAGKCRVDMRSKSRLGRKDFNANLNRIRHFMSQL
jgi:hypothetical protein